MTTLEAVPLEEVLRDVLDGVKIEGVPHLEDLTPEHIALVMLRVQQMRRAQIKHIENLAEDAAKAVAKATKTRVSKFINTPGTQDFRTQASKLAAADDVFAADAAKATLEAAREYLGSLKDDWDTARSINANSRAKRSAIEGMGPGEAKHGWRYPGTSLRSLRRSLRSDNITGICHRTPECHRIRAQRVRRARGIRSAGDSLRERLFSNLTIDPSGCLIWTGILDRAGYGKIRVGERIRGVHVAMWEFHEGQSIPEGMELDHLCHSRDPLCLGGAGCLHRRCASLSHLEVVTRLTNNRRAISRPVARAALGRPHSSQYTGVTWHKKCRKWQAAIKVAGKARYLGLFGSEEAAALAYDVAVQEVASEYSLLAGETGG